MPLHYTIRTDSKAGEPVDRLFPTQDILSDLLNTPDTLVGFKKLTDTTGTLYITGPSDLLRKLAERITL